MSGAHDFLSLFDGDDLAALIHRIRKPVERDVRGRRVALLWGGLAVRNRAALDLAAAELGVVCVEAKSHIGGRETIRDLAGYLDNWFDLLVVRGSGLADLEELAVRADARVLNAGGPDNHPVEVLSDLAYLTETVGHLDGLRVVFVGPATNVLASWAEAAARLPIHLTQISPERFRSTHDHLTWRSDLRAVEQADVLYTDCWWPVRLAPEHDKPHIRAELDPFQVTAELLARTPPHSLLLHGPPLTAGLEIETELLDSPRYHAYRAKAWLLPTFAALLRELLP